MIYNKLNTVCLLLCVLLPQLVHSSPKVVPLSFTKKYGNSIQDAQSHFKPRLRLFKRQDGYELVELTNQQSFYSVDLSIGTPSQEVTVLVDTGSSDLWVTGSNNPYCIDNFNSNSNSNLDTDDLIDCEQYGVFDISDSKSFTKNQSAPVFFISYGDTTFASGIWGQDVLHLEDLNITGLSFAVANRTNSSVGVMGIGFSGLEMTNVGTDSNKPYTYDNFPMVLKRSGAINSLTYSLYLNKLTEEHGSILFGGVDHSKYTGNLYTIPIINTLSGSGISNPIQFDVTLQGIGISTNNSSKNDNNNNDDDDDQITITTTKIPALLDSGTTLTYLPQEILEQIADQIGAQYSARIGYYIVPCDDDEQSTSFDSSTNLVFDFGGFHINTSLNDYLIKISRTSCMIGLLPYDSNKVILGDTFLSHAYVVYDLENYQIGLAQAKFDVDDDDSQIEIINGTSGIPSATKAPRYSSTWSSNMRSTSLGNIFTNLPYGNPMSSLNSNDVALTTTTITSGDTTIVRTSSRLTTTTSTSRSSATSTRNANNSSNGSSVMNNNLRTYFIYSILFIFLLPTLLMF